MLYDLSGGVKNHQILGVAFPRRSLPLAGKRPFDALRQPVQRNGGQQGGEGTLSGVGFLSCKEHLGLPS